VSARPCINQSTSQYYHAAWRGDVDDAEAAPQYRYLGCFKDVDGVGRDLTGRDLVLTELTTDACAGQCQPVGFAYFGLQFGRRCLCGDDYGSHGPSVGQSQPVIDTITLIIYPETTFRI